MKRSDIHTGETYTVAKSEGQLDRDPEAGFGVKVMGNAIQMALPGSDRKEWVVPVESACGADLWFLWHRRWAVKVPGIEGRFLLKTRYLIEPFSLMEGRLAAFEARRAEYNRKRNEAEAMGARIDALGVVKTQFVRGDHIDGEYLSLIVPYDKVETLISALTRQTQDPE